MSTNKKISILGSGRVGSSIAYALTLGGKCSEIVLVDIKKEVAEGEAMDIIQGTPFSHSVNIYAGDYADTAGSAVVIVTLGMARKPGQTRIELAQANVDIVKNVMPEVVKHAPNSIYLFVSNPVDVMTYAAMKVTGLPRHQIIGSGTLLDSGRLRTIIAEEADINPSSVHGYVLGEHGDSSVVPWSLVTIGGMGIQEYGMSAGKKEGYSKDELLGIEKKMRESGAKIIKGKGATNYAIAMSVNSLCDIIIRDTNSIVPISVMMTGEYGIADVCLSIPCILGSNGLVQTLQPTLTEDEKQQLQHSAEVLKNTISTLNF